MTLENTIKDVIAQKMQDGTVEKLIAEQVEKGVTNALNSLFGSYGGVTKVIEKQVKAVMVPYIEGYDFSQYLVKMDAVLVDVLKHSAAADNKALLQNFKELMLPEDREEIKASTLFKVWCDYVAKNVETDGLEIDYEDGVRYQSVEVMLGVDFDEDRGWSSFDYATLTLTCEHDEKMNFAIRLSRYKKDKKDHWSISYDSVKDISSLRHLNEFEILLMRLNQARTKLIMDMDYKCDEVQPEKEPEARFE